MARGEKPERQRQAAENDRQPSKPVKRRRFRTWFTLALLAALVWFLPVIVVNSPALHWIINMAAADLNGSVVVDSASAGWLSPICVRGVEVRDRDGKPILAVPQISGDRTLAAIALHYTQLGRFRVERLKLAVTLRDDGSNVEDLLAKYLYGPAPNGGKPATPTTKFDVAVEIVDGAISVTDQSVGRTWQIEKLTTVFGMSSEEGGAMAVSASVELPDVRQPGKLKAEWKSSSAAGEAALAAEHIPLANFRPLLSRLMPKASLSGHLGSSLRASWGNTKDAASGIQAEFNIDELALAGASLQGDVVRLNRLHGSCQTTRQTNGPTTLNASLECDVGNMTLASTAPMDGQDGYSFDAMVKQRHDLRGLVDLAGLARMLPATLRLRQGVQINSGQVQWALVSQPGPQGAVCQAEAEVSRLTADHQGRQFAWERPVYLRLDVQQNGQQPMSGRLSCQSDFLKIDGEGSLDNLSASASFNLTQLADPLGQFVDLSGMAMAGEGFGSLNWKRSDQGEFAADSTIQVHQLQLALPNQLPWHEDNLQVYGEAKGRTDFTGNTQIDSAVVKAAAGPDLLEMQIAQPQAGPGSSGVWPITAKMKGNLQSWPARLGMWLPMTNWQMAGNYELEAQGNGSKDGVELRQTKLAIAPLAVASPIVNINEPRLDALVAGGWNQTQRRLQLSSASVACSAAAIEASNLVVGMPKTGPVEMAGALKYQGQLDRIRQWFAAPAAKALWQAGGQFSGAAQFTQSAGRIHGENTTEIANLTVVDAAGGRFQEPKIQLVARGDYDNQTGMLQLDQCELQSSIVAVNAKGRTGAVQGQQVAEVDGQIGYDLDRAVAMLRPYIGPGVRIAGRGASPAWYRGPLSLAACEAGAGVRWDGANIYGFQLGQGEIKAALSKGLLQIEPLHLAVSQGQVHLAPKIRLAPEPMELVLPPGPVAERVQIDPTMCAWWMKYVMPVAADTTTAKGSFSLNLKSCRIPLSDPAKGDLSGELKIHSIEVGPGPLARTFSVLLGKETPASLQRESVVPFQMVNGRVYHQNMELLFADFVIRTSGWVGLDQTLNIMAEMPVPPKWLINNPLAEGLKKQTIRLPVAGTLSKPELDKRAMEQYTRQFVQRAAENLIENAVEQNLDRLFGK